MQSKLFFLACFIGVFFCDSCCFDKRKIEETYPFNKARQIQIISYQDRNIWDTLSDKEFSYIPDEVIKDGKIRLDKSRLKECLKVDSAKKKELFDILFNIDCYGTVKVAACYDPRHSIIFYDSKNKAIGSIEICFECSNSHSSMGIEHIDLCPEKLSELNKFFKKSGVKYFGQDEQQD